MCISRLHFASTLPTSNKEHKPATKMALCFLFVDLRQTALTALAEVGFVSFLTVFVAGNGAMIFSVTYCSN